LAPVIAFGAYIGAARAVHEDFNASRMFASLILINLLASPLIRLLQIIPSFGAAIGCFTRLENFLARPELLASKECSTYKYDSGSGHTKIETEFPEKVSNHAEENFSGLSTDLPSICIRQGNFGWGAEPVLVDISFEVHQGEHVVITGPVGCGKSLLLHAILGEVVPQAGSVQLEGVGVGYCGQVPWLENMAARENAFRCTTTDTHWEQTIIDACALGDLLGSQLSGKTVGSGGARISGGERQRLVC
jgi:ATP-binding cassette subfamily C (CFTR/MRP) protein 1